MIDHLLTFDSESAAKADGVVGAYFTQAWRGDVCIPDVRVTQVSSGRKLSGWTINISAGSAVRELVDHPAVAFVFDRNAANSGQKFVVLSANSDFDFADLAFDPFFAGSRVPDRINVPAKGDDAKTRGEWSRTVFKPDALVKDRSITLAAKAG